MRRKFPLVLLTALALAGCGDKSALNTPAPTKSPEDFLRWAMDRYAAIPTYQADIEVVMTGGMAGGVPQKRILQYERPNRYRVISEASRDLMQTCVSNGSRALEYSTAESIAHSFAAPATLADAEGAQMKHPMVCGSLFYQFFAGADNFECLVKSSKGDVTFGAEVTREGEKCRTLKFYGQQQYGNVQVIIGEKTGWVYQIRYDSEPMISMMADPGATSDSEPLTQSNLHQMDTGSKKEESTGALPEGANPSGVTLSKFDTIETYSHIQSPGKFSPGTFDTSLPEGKTIEKEGAIPVAEPPVPIGQLAPDFEVTSLTDKRTIKLSSLRGRPVLIEFWSTWSDRKGLGAKAIDRISQAAGPLGLEVMVISKEDESVVGNYMQIHRHAFPTYVDPLGEANQAFRTRVLPTTVIVDGDGILRSYKIGVQDAKSIADELAKIGLKLR